jgi:DNA-binding NarL/FixJ family response regulator
MIRVLIVDDHPIYRDGLRSVVQLTPDMEVVGETDSGEEAIQFVLDICPDVVLLDVRMPPGMDGIAATSAIRAKAPQTQVILLSQFDDKLVAGMQAGAAGYLIKTTFRAHLLEAIRRVATGQVYLHPNVQQATVTALRQPRPTLTEIETKILSLIALGMTNRAIGAELSYAQGTVKQYISAILSKLNAHDRTHAVTIAREHSLIT